MNDKIKSIYKKFILIIYFLSIAFLCFISFFNYKKSNTTINTTNSKTSFFIFDYENDSKNRNIYDLFLENNISFEKITTPNYNINLQNNNSTNWVLIANNQITDTEINMVKENYNLNGIILFEPTKIDILKNLDIPILLISTSFSEKSNPNLITAFYNDLTNSKINNTGFSFNAQKGNVELIISAQTYKKINLYDKAFTNNICNWINKNYNENLHYNSNNYFLIGFLFNVISLILICISYDMQNFFNVKETVYHIIDIKIDSHIKYLFSRIPILLISILLFAIMTFLFWITKITPFNSSLVIVNYIFSFGLIAQIFFKTNKIPGIIGKIDKRNAIPVKKSMYIFSLIGLLPIIFIIFMLKLSNTIKIEISIKNAITSAIFAFALYFGFYIFMKEFEILSDTKKVKFIYSLIIALPLIIIMLISIPIGNYTWIYTCCIDILLLLIITIMGYEVNKIIYNPYFIAFVNSIIYALFLGMIKKF